MQHMIYGYKGDTVIIAQYEIHKVFRKSNCQDWKTRAKSKLSNGPRHAAEVSRKGEGTGTQLQHCLPSVSECHTCSSQILILQFTSRQEGSERSPCPRSPHC